MSKITIEASACGRFIVITDVIHGIPHAPSVISVQKARDSAKALEGAVESMAVFGDDVLVSHLRALELDLEQAIQIADKSNGGAKAA